VRICLIVLLALAGCPVLAQTDRAAKPLVLFSQRGSEVTTEEFLYLFKKNHPKKEDRTPTKIDAYIDLLIAFKAKVAEATNRGYDTTRSFRKELATYRDELRKPFVATEDVVNYLTRQAYERMTLEVRASHVLVSVEPSATPADTLAAYQNIMGLRERILKGEDFATLARSLSQDPTAKANSGDLGYFTVFQMVYLFEEAAYSMKTGEVSMPVRTQFGYHLLKVTDRRIARGEVEVSHIILRGPRDDKKIKAKIFEVRQQLDAGRPWDEVCKEFSDDPATKNTGGRLRPFGVGALASVPEFEAVAFSLHNPGEISDPFQSTFGWHIVRLERRIPLAPFEQVQESLKKRVSRDPRLKIAEEKAFTGKLATMGFVEEATTKQLVMSAADSTLQKGNWRARGVSDVRGRTLFQLKGKAFPASAFFAYVEVEQEPNRQSPREYMEQLYSRYLRAAAGDLEDEELMRTNEEYRNLVREYREGILLFTIMEKEVWNRASEDTTGLRIFYESNKSRYAAGERVRARVYTSDDSVFVLSTLKRLQSGDSLRKDDTRRFKSMQGPRNFAQGESKAVDRVPKVVGLYAARVDASYCLVQVESLVPPGIRPITEIRSQVISDYQDYLEAAWVKTLKSKYPAKVNSKGKKFVYKELTMP
jgi:peptidyl-prolyl cis-trans isomerase SurA